jgi:hypothetical protein
VKPVARAAATNVGSLPSNQLTVPRSRSRSGLTLPGVKFKLRRGGAFTLLARSRGGLLDYRAVQAAADRGSTVLRKRKAGPVLPASPTVADVELRQSCVTAEGKG